jgi:hypothetical protein
MCFDKALTAPQTPSFETWLNTDTPAASDPKSRALCHRDLNLFDECDFVSALALSNDSLQAPLSFGKVGRQSGLASSRRQKTTRHAESVLGLQRDTVEGGSILMPPPDSLSLMFD